MTPAPPRRPDDKPPDPHCRIQIEDIRLQAVIHPCRHTVEAVNHQNLTFRVADGSHVKPLGSCILRVTMQNQTQPFEFTVMPKCSHGVILGLVFLKASQAVLDCGRKKLTFDEMTFEPQHPNRSDVFTVEH
ncbi:hypothetical protein AVEN_100051-1 [Araneus ventricosus]|uniref:Uncharacterized protein n=1 Tax=Araneus ventricosus TaxID=182803 RepID=A0A4Y2QQ60_ARAVE|nr:hypothetical protein AVEN_100051-1 [Araneus ventricosus]